MNELQIFNNDHFEVRAAVKNGEPLFVAADVCKALDIQNHIDALKRLDDDEKSGIDLNDPHGRTQTTNVVTESGLYSLVLGSRKPEAKQFKRWVTHEVIPSIRRHGAYMTTDTIKAAIADPDFSIRLLTTLKEDQAARKALEAQAAADAPKVLFADAVSASRTSILVGELAKLLRQNGVDIGQNRLFAFLRENGYLIFRNGSDYNMPTQRSMERGWFSIKETAITHADGTVTVSKTVKVTGKGQQYFLNLFLSAPPWN